RSRRLPKSTLFPYTTLFRSLLALWPVANGPELLTSTGAASGIAEAFSNPVQHIREDFGTARLDQIFTQLDSLAGVYTADDSEAQDRKSTRLNSSHVEISYAV